MLRSNKIQTDCSEWIFSRWTDFLVISNLYWPLFLIPGLVSGNETGPIEFIQVYLLASPHRWLTLTMVMTDKSRRSGIECRMLFAAILIALLIVIVELSSGMLLCMLWIDYFWNAFHFASQHGGILALNCRRNQIVLSRLLKWQLRFVITSIILMLPLNPINRNFPAEILQILVTVGFIAIMINAIRIGIYRSLPAALYLISILGIYGGLLTTTLMQLHRLSSGFMLASSVMHSVEYFAIVSRYVITRDQTTGKVFNISAWRGKLTIYALLVASILYAFQRISIEMTGAVNLWAAFLHYTYDGWIWKLREAKNSALIKLTPKGV